MERDSHFLHIIGNLYNCNMIGRGNLIRITGEELQVEKVIQLIYELRYLLKRNIRLSQRQIYCNMRILYNNFFINYKIHSASSSPQKRCKADPFK